MVNNMKFLIILLALLGSLLLTACKFAKILGFRQQEPPVTSFPNTLKEVKAIERRLDSEDISFSYVLQIDEGLYPNKLHFNLVKVKRYLHAHLNEGIRHTIEYFATADDTVRVILHEWTIGRIDPEAPDKVMNAINNKFTNLDSTFTSLLGTPIVRNIKNGFQQETERDDVKWTGNQLNAYLLMFKRDSSFYRQIRLVVYPK